MSPGPMSGGPPPPDNREDQEQQSAQPTPLPPSMMMAQGEQQNQKAQQGQGLQKEVLNLAMTKLLDFKNAAEGLLTAMRSVDPESVALFGPVAEVGKALEDRLQKVVQRAGAQQPSMAGMPGAQPGPQGMPPQPQQGPPQMAGMGA